MLNEGLTERERRGLEHLQRAQEQRLRLSEYARQAGIKVSEIYSVKQSLVRKGVFAGRTANLVEPPMQAMAGEFVAVQVSGGFSTHAPSCQIRHPSGMVIECSSLPPIAWVRGLLGGVSDVLA
jgi:hypothetical protein